VLHRCEARERSGCSPEHERRRRGGATATEDDGGELLAARGLESRRELESGGETCGGGQGWCSPFIGGGGEAATTGLMALTPLMAGKG
jgi:hypothetical protein